MTPEYITLLTPSERHESFRAGMLVAAAREGIPLTKSASGLKDIIDGIAAIGNFSVKAPPAVLKTIGGIALLAGIPAGAAWHAAGRASSGRRNAEEEGLARVRNYRTIAKQIEEELARRSV